MAIVPLLKDEAAKSFLKKLSDSKLQSYTDAQRKETDKKVEALFPSEKSRIINSEKYLQKGDVLYEIFCGIQRIQNSDH